MCWFVSVLSPDLLLLTFVDRWLYRDGLVPEKTYFIGYARSKMSMEDIRQKALPFMKVRGRKGEAIFTCLKYSIQLYLDHKHLKTN